MPDIAMCLGHNCPFKQTCVRYRAVPGKWQTYVATPYDLKAGSCEYYVEVTESDIRSGFVREVPDQTDSDTSA